MTIASPNRVLVHTGARHPILQAPMGFIARAPLASAVSLAGGLGIVETSSGEIETCLAEVDRMLSAPEVPFGVNLPIRFLRDDRIVDTLTDRGVRFFTTSAGDPSVYLERLKRDDAVVYHVVPSVHAARKAAASGVDGLIVEGGEGGGFKSPDDVSTLVLLRAVRRAVDLPLVAAGGIADGYGMAAAFALGAEAVQMGTRFLVSRESPVHSAYKRAIIDAQETGTVMLNRSGRPAVRALQTERTRTLGSGAVDVPDLLRHIRAVYFEGDLNASVASAGQSAGLVDDEPSAAEIVDRTMTEFAAAVAELVSSADDLIGAVAP